MRARVQADPEHARRFCRGKKSVAAKPDIQRGRHDRREHLLDPPNAGFGLFANEFERDMQRLGIGPTCIRREPLHALREAGDALADGVGDVESDEEPHKISFQRRDPSHPQPKNSETWNWQLEARSRYINFLLTMSRAMVLAKRRMRLRSPGKLRCTTSVPRSLATAWNTSPTGFSSVPPPGPATPVIPTPRVDSQR